MQDIIPKEKIANASDVLIREGAMGAAFFLVFLAAIVMIWFVLRAAAREIKTAREATEKANERSIQLATKTVEVNTKLVDRQDIAIEMSEKILGKLELIIERNR